MMRLLLSFTFFLGSFTLVKAQVNVGSTALPDASAALQVTSSTQGFRLPQINLTNTTTFGLTAPTVTSAAYGMMVYNSNASITGSSSYPAYGVGVYTWDGTGWRSDYHTSRVDYIGSGAVSAALANNTPAFLDISNTYIQSSNITLSGTTGITVHASGNYKIDVTIVGTLSASQTLKGDMMCYIYVNGGIVDKASAAVLPVSSGVTSGLPFAISRSYIRSAASAGDNIQIQAWSLGLNSGTCVYQVISVQVTKLN